MEENNEKIFDRTKQDTNLQQVWTFMTLKLPGVDDAVISLSGLIRRSGQIEVITIRYHASQIER